LKNSECPVCRRAEEAKPSLIAVIEEGNPCGEFLAFTQGVGRFVTLAIFVYLIFILKASYLRIFSFKIFSFNLSKRFYLTVGLT
jgi:hypothetical protein